MQSRFHIYFTGLNREIFSFEVLHNSVIHFFTVGVFSETLTFARTREFSSVWHSSVIHSFMVGLFIEALTLARTGEFSSVGVYKI